MRAVDSTTLSQHQGLTEHACYVTLLWNKPQIGDPSDKAKTESPFYTTLLKAERGPASQPAEPCCLDHLALRDRESVPHLGEGGRAGRRAGSPAAPRQPLLRVSALSLPLPVSCLQLVSSTGSPHKPQGSAQWCAWPPDPSTNAPFSHPDQNTEHSPTATGSPAPVLNLDEWSPRLIS